MYRIHKDDEKSVHGTTAIKIIHRAKKVQIIRAKSKVSQKLLNTRHTNDTQRMHQTVIIDYPLCTNKKQCIEHR